MLAAFATKGSDGIADLARTRGVPDRERPRQAVYVDPFLTDNPKTPGEREGPERVDVIAVTHGHCDHVGDTVALSQRFPECRDRREVELKGWLGEEGANIGECPG